MNGGTAQLRVDRAVAATYPTYRAIVVYADGLVNGPSDPAGADHLRHATRLAREELAGRRPAEHPHIGAWRRTFSSFGAKPSRYRSSVEALLARALDPDGRPPRVNALVDAYNAVSIEHFLPIGGEDRAQLSGEGRLTFAVGDETFVVFHGHEEEAETPRPGEVVWADDLGVTCRRWNWRQCRRTQLTEQTTEAYFLLEAIERYPVERLEHAAASLCGRILERSPQCRLELDRLPRGS